MPRVSKEKQKETLSKMKDRRYEDMVFLREISKKKLDWATEEHKKGLEAIEQHKKQIENLKVQVTRLEGYLHAMKEINTAKKESPNDSSNN